MSNSNPDSNSNSKPKRQTAPKTDKATLALVQAEYVNGTCKSIAELASKYNIHQTTLGQRIIRENWAELRNLKMRELEEKVSEKVQSIGETYLKSTFQRMKRYEKMIEASQQNLGSKDVDGTPLLDPDAINTYTLAESRIFDISKSALRIPEVKQQMDLTSAGQSLGESLVSAIAKLRATPGQGQLSEQEKQRILEAEIVEDSIGVCKDKSCT